MHPAGIKFGLEYKMLEFRGSDVVVTGEFLEHMSEAARRRVQKNNRLTGEDLWEEVVHAGVEKLFPRNGVTNRRSEVTPFFTGLNRVASTTLIPLAEKAKVGRRLGRDLIPEDRFTPEFGTRIGRFKIGNDMVQNRRICFRICRDTVRSLFAENDPENIRHADLLAIRVYEFLVSSGVLNVTLFFEAVKQRHPVPPGSTA
jgi:hypothetical protein